MQGLIFPLALLVLLGIWGAFESGRKFRREFAKRGISWEAVCQGMGQTGGEGVLAVDTLWGPQRGLGRPVIWWLESPPADGADLGQIIRGDAQAGGQIARLVPCPRAMRSAQALRAKFGEPRIIIHSWAVNQELLGAGAPGQEPG